jgi:hypothetical protein
MPELKSLHRHMAQTRRRTGGQYSATLESIVPRLKAAMDELHKVSERFDEQDAVLGNTRIEQVFAMPSVMDVQRRGDVAALAGVLSVQRSSSSAQSDNAFNVPLERLRDEWISHRKRFIVNQTIMKLSHQANAHRIGQLSDNLDESRRVAATHNAKVKAAAAGSPNNSVHHHKQREQEIRRLANAVKLEFSPEMLGTQRGGGGAGVSKTGSGGSSSTSKRRQRRGVLRSGTSATMIADAAAAQLQDMSPAAGAAMARQALRFASPSSTSHAQQTKFPAVSGGRRHVQQQHGSSSKVELP